MTTEAQFDTADGRCSLRTHATSPACDLQHERTAILSTAFRCLLLFARIATVPEHSAAPAMAPCSWLQKMSGRSYEDASKSTDM